MTNKWKVLLIGALLWTASFPASAVLDLPASQVQAAAPTVEVDKSSVRRGQSVTVTGTFAPNSWITLRAVDSKGDLVVFDGVKSGADGAYTFEVAVPDSTASGVLELYTGAGEDVARASIRVTTGSSGDGSTGGSGAPAPNAAQPQSVTGGVLTYKPDVAESADGRKEAAIAVDANAVLQALGQNPEQLTITVDTEADLFDVRIAGEALQELLGADRTAAVEVVTAWGTYELPLAVVDREALAAALVADEDEVVLRIVISKASDAQASSLNAAADELNADVLAAYVEFHVEAVDGEGEALELAFGDTYVVRTLPLTGQVNASRTTGVRYDENAGKFVFVPSVFQNADGEWRAELKRNGNSLYTVIAHSKSFDDIPAGHWGKDEIELLASKLIISGLTENAFGPSETVTRAEFAALIVRALGLDEQGESAFTDVRATAWYASAVGAAYEAGLVAGYEDGSFRPNRPITRQELAMLMNNALVFVGQDKADADGQLSPFTDRGEIADWAQAAVARIAEAGITQGRGDHRFEPTAVSNRAEAAAMIKRLLQHVNFID